MKDPSGAWHEEPISRKHDREAIEVMNQFLQRYARQSHESGGTKTFLAIEQRR